MSTDLFNLSRREALRGMGGLVLGLAFPVGNEPLSYGPPDGPEADDWFGPYVRIAKDGVVTLRVPASEMGQGTHTGLAMVLAEELDLPLDGVHVEMAPADDVYGYKSQIGRQQMTVGSGSVRGWWGPLALAGASARAMLVEAAASRWGCDAAQCRTEGGAVICGDKRATYGELSADAAKLPVPKATPKPASAWKLVGTSPPRVDLARKLDGSAVFGIDVKVPGMVHATVVHAPVFGATLSGLDDTEAKKAAGFAGTHAFEDFFAVIADSTWHARMASAAVKATWDGEQPGLDDAEVSRRLNAALDGKLPTWKREGNADKALAAAAKVVEATYEVPYLHHCTMEPPNATAHVHDGIVEIWAPTQAQSRCRDAVAKALRVSKDDVLLHTTLLGGGYGRKSEVDYVVEAARIADAVGKPVKVTWTREEDFAHGFYRPAFAARLRAAVGADGIDALDVKLAGQDIVARFLPGTLLDHLPALGSFAGENFHELPYDVPHQHMQYQWIDLPIPVGWWRSVQASFNGFFRECFLDECAQAAGADPLAFRLARLGPSPRHAAALRKVAEMAAWEKREGRALGLAVVESFGSIVAQVAQVRVDGKKLRVEKVWVAFDCGRCVHPGLVKAQAEGAVNMGLSAAFGERVRLANGAVATPNFYAYPLLRMAQSPEVEVAVLEGDPDGPGGVGEPALPPIAPAVCNAIFAATGTRVRKLPLAEQFEV